MKLVVWTAAEELAGEICKKARGDLQAGEGLREKSTFGLCRFPD